MEASHEVILTPDQGIRVFVSSTLEELADERRYVRQAIESLMLVPVMFELGARPHPPRDVYRAYLRQSHVFIGVYAERYGWVAPGESISGLEDELRLSAEMPQLLYLKRPTGDVDPRLQALLDEISRKGLVSYRRFHAPADLAEQVAHDLSVLVTERFLAHGPATLRPEPGQTVDPPPIPSTPTLGRDRDIAHVADMIRGGARIVTITGPGGTGKSRLALELARHLEDDFPDGVAFTALEDVTDPGAVLSSVARALRVGDRGVGPLRQVLIDRLRGQRVLLVLDNMEQIAAAGPDVADVIDHTDHVATLITSRQPLHLRGEHEYPLAPLAVPDSGDTEDLLSVPSIALFVRQMQAVDPHHLPSPDELVVIAELCRRLDGLPLAIELAAARTRLLPPRVLLEQLGERLDLLGGGATDLPARQRTMRATLDWSYQLLDEAEKALLARCSVFAGATLDAVDAICADEHVPDTSSMLLSLVDKNLLVADVEASNPPRIRMLRTVHTYAAERLVHRGEAERIGSRHARWYADLVEPADVFRHVGATGCWPTLETEIGNLRHAADYALDHLDYPLIIDLARRLWTWLRSTGRIAELRAGLDRALANIPDGIDIPHIGALYDIAAYVAGLGGDIGHALDLSERAIRALDDAEDEESAVLAANAHLTHASLQSVATAAEDVLPELDLAVELARTHRNVAVLANATSTRGLLHSVLGDTTSARRDHDESLHLAEDLHNDVLIAQATGLLGLVDVLDGDPVAARRQLKMQAALLAPTGNLEGLANALDIAAALAGSEHRWQASLDASMAATKIRERIALPPWPFLRPLRAATLQNALDRLDRHDPPPAEPQQDLDPWTVLKRTLDVPG